MAGRQLHRLSALRVAKAVDPGHYADGGGLFMQIAGSGARSWVFRFTLDRRVREMGLGPLSRVSLGEARKLATQYREMVRDQIDPILARREEQRRRMLDISIDANVTFREAAEAFIRAHEPEWRNRKHSQQWGNTLKTYAYPIIGNVRVRDIDTAMIVRILQPIWTKKAETARRVRGRIKAILDAETVMGHRTGSNPARYVDHLQLVLPRSKKRSRVRHHAALPWEDIPTFIRELEQRPRRARESTSRAPTARASRGPCDTSSRPTTSRTFSLPPTVWSRSRRATRRHVRRWRAISPTPARRPGSWQSQLQLSARHRRESMDLSSSALSRPAAGDRPYLGSYRGGAGVYRS